MLPNVSSRIAVCLAALIALHPSSAAAQQDVFRNALIRFHSALAGDFGDEGSVVVGSLDAMASSLAAWDETIRGTEKDLQSRLPSAAPVERARIVTALAEMYVARGRSADAVRTLDEAIQRDGGRGSLHVLRGLVLEALGRPAEAVASFRRAWQIDSDDPASSYLLASNLAPDTASDEMTPQVVRLLKAHERRLSSVPGDRHIALVSELAFLPDRAAATPVFSPALYADGFASVGKGRFQEAIASFRAAAQRDPLVTGTRSWPERFQAGISKLRQGDAKGAIPHLEAAAAAAPRSSEVHRILAAAYGEAGNDGKSIEHLETAAALAPADERAGVALGRALAHAGRIERAESVLLKIVAALPQSADAHSALADLYERSERGRNAVRELEAAASFTIIAGKASLYWRLADLQHRHLEYDRVIAPLTRRVRLNPNDARAHTDLGLAYTRVGQTTNALVELLMAALLGPDDAENLTAIGQIHFDAGDYGAAERVLRRAAAVGPALAQTHYTLGHTLARLGRSDESQVELAEFERLRAAADEAARQTYQRLIEEQRRGR